MKQKDKYVVGLTIITITVISFFFIFNIINILRDMSPKSSNVAYIANTKDNISYSVHIIDNPYIEDNILLENSSYVTSLIEKIDFSFNYEYTTDRDINLSYSYLIVATIVSTSASEGMEKVNNPIWVKDYVLLNESAQINNNQKININETIEIFLDSYNDLVNNFIEDYNVLINSAFEIKLIIKINNNVNNKNINNEHYLMASIPLGIKAFDITTSKNFVESESVYLNPLPKKESSYMKIIIYIVFILLLIGIGYYVIKKIIEKYSSKYILEKNRILKDYDDKIVEVNNFVKYENWEMVDVKMFEELLDLSNEAFEPIFYWEKRVHRNRETWFCILRDRVIYRYILHKNQYRNE